MHCCIEVTGGSSSAIPCVPMRATDRERVCTSKGREADSEGEREREREEEEEEEDVRERVDSVLHPLRLSCLLWYFQTTCSKQKHDFI